MNPRIVNPELVQLSPARLLLFLLILPFSGEASDTGDLLQELNQALIDKVVYREQRQDKIAHLVKQYEHCRRDDRCELAIGTQIYQEYRSFEYDSAFAYAQRISVLAQRINDPQQVEMAKLNLAFIHVSSGMFKETFDILSTVRPALLDSANKVEFYFIEARSYSDLADFNSSAYYQPIYTRKAIASVDTALRYARPGSYEYLSMLGFRGLKSHDIAGSRVIYDKILRLPGLTLHQFAVNASAAAWVYELAGDMDKSYELLIRASIADVKTATTETVALFKLSDLCYRRGDLKNAYTFIKQAQEDVTFYNSRLRQIQIHGIFSVIEGQRISIIENQRKTLTIYALAVTTLVLFVIAFAVVIFKQLKKLQRADALISVINQELQQNNQHLSQLNQQLVEVNHRLNEANRIKDEYVGYYFNISSEYIDKIERIKHSADRTLLSKQYEATQRVIDNINIKKERNELFKGFDTVFLKLFPHFVAAFNELLYAQEQIVLPEDQLLNTELRIFALIRLGIDDSERISKILGYTISTIYTYKTRVKKKSMYPNEEFEGRVRTI